MKSLESDLEAFPEEFWAESIMVVNLGMFAT